MISHVYRGHVVQQRGPNYSTADYAYKVPAISRAYRSEVAAHKAIDQLIASQAEQPQERRAA